MTNNCRLHAGIFTITNKNFNYLMNSSRGCQ